MQDLEELPRMARGTEESRASRLAVDDGPLLAFAEERGIRAWEAQALALERGVVPSRYLRNIPSLSLEEQLRLSRSRVFVCGCGGLGGTLVELLARTGVGRITVVDGDVFTESNLNRQRFSDTPALGRPKALVVFERVREVNPLVEITAHQGLLTEANADGLLEGVDLAVDALDNIEGRFILAEAARRAGIPYLHGAATGWWGQVLTIPAGSAVDLTCVYGGRRTRAPEEVALGILGPTAAAVASLEALEAVRLLAGRPPAYAGKMLYFDGEAGECHLVAL